MPRLGEKNPRSKLKWRDVVYIARNEDGMNQAQLADKFNVSISAISHIHTGRTWGHITRELGILPYRKEPNPWSVDDD